MKAPRTAVSRENLAEKLMSPVNLLYTPPRTPAIIMPATWKGMFKPPNPQGDKNPLMSITKLPKNAPTIAPSVRPMTKVKKEVNSTFGGLGIIWRARHKAARIMRKASFRVFIVALY
jgi:hypothetical protein